MFPARHLRNGWDKSLGRFNPLNAPCRVLRAESIHPIHTQDDASFPHCQNEENYSVTHLSQRGEKNMLQGPGMMLMFWAIKGTFSRYLISDHQYDIISSLFHCSWDTTRYRIQPPPQLRLTTSRWHSKSEISHSETKNLTSITHSIDHAAHKTSPPWCMLPIIFKQASSSYR